MNLLTNNVSDKEDEIINLIESGEALFFITKNGEQFIVDREELNDKNATTLNCCDGSISTFDIDDELLELFGDAKCYTDFQTKIIVT